MSGGLDSPAVAAYARDALSKRQNGVPPFAITIAHHGGEELKYATIAAAALRIPMQHLTFDDFPYFSGWNTPSLNRPEPTDLPILAFDAAFRNLAAQYGRVILTGYDGDALLTQSRHAYITSLLDEKRYGRMLLDSLAYIRSKRRLPRFLIPALLSNRAMKTQPFEGFPEWVNPDFAKRARLRERWKEIWNLPIPKEYETRWHSYSDLTSTNWNFKFVNDDPGVTRVPIETRHPLADIRLIGFCMSRPQVPWCLDKYILREAMKAVLPEPILRRPKTTLSPFVNPSGSDHEQIKRSLVSSELVKEYVTVEAVPLWDASHAPGTHWLHRRPLELSHWLEFAALD
jgi:asparagine synthase (glutamine-hydrolysing)